MGIFFVGSILSIFPNASPMILLNRVYPYFLTSSRAEKEAIGSSFSALGLTVGSHAQSGKPFDPLIQIFLETRCSWYSQCYSKKNLIPIHKNVLYFFAMTKVREPDSFGMTTRWKLHFPFFQHFWPLRFLYLDRSTRTRSSCDR
jgi:hypothetical protein